MSWKNLYSPAQVDLVVRLVNERFAENDDAGRNPFRTQFKAATSQDDITKLINDLRAVPTMARREQAERDAKAREVRPTEEGLYRNPETGELYRLKRNKDGEMIVSKYSLTGGPRRLLADESEIVKGAWKRYTAFQSRLAFIKGTVHKDWLIDAKELATEYAYGFCPLHYGPLTDGISVTLGYGPDCAEKYGLPWGQEYADAKIAARKLASTGVAPTG